MKTVRRITLNNGTVIIERQEEVMGHPCYAYYYKGVNAFGTPDRFNRKMLQVLYDNGYFEPFEEET